MHPSAQRLEQSDILAVSKLYKQPHSLVLTSDRRATVFPNISSILYTILCIYCCVYHLVNECACMALLCSHFHIAYKFLNATEIMVFTEHTHKFVWRVYDQKWKKSYEKSARTHTLHSAHTIPYKNAIWIPYFRVSCVLCRVCVYACIVCVESIAST